MLHNRINERLIFKKFKEIKPNSIFLQNVFSHRALLLGKIFNEIKFGNYVIKLAETKSELKKAQALRYSIFYKEKKAKPSILKQMLGLDFDKVDKFADHLILVDKGSNAPKNRIVGTYRLIRGDVSVDFGGFYTSSEFNLSNILNGYKHSQILELGRSCVHKDYRNGTAMNLLWKAIAEYVKLFDIKIILGCASFSGTNIMKFSNELSYLQENFSLPDDLSVESLDNNVYPDYKKTKNNIDNFRTFAKLPPLIKGYLRVGGKVSDSVYVDYNFNTIDLCVIIETDNIDKKYKKKFLTY
ncbi:GNAT family N-acetyltransferase [Alphaproteobacteria bacterium]|nr:GNAT family N-acetyltransferase [Alphaproteobacteria bacterium]